MSTANYTSYQSEIQRFLAPKPSAFMDIFRGTILNITYTQVYTPEIFALLGCYAAQIDSQLPTFRHNVSIPS
jgi:hypothetical protein